MIDLTRGVAEEIGLCEAVAAGRLREQGYEVDGGGGAEFGAYAHYLRVAAHRRLASRKREMLDRLRRRDEPSEVAARAYA